MEDEIEVVDALDQLAMSLSWDEQNGRFTDEYKRRVLIDAIKFIYLGWQKSEL